MSDFEPLDDLLREEIDELPVAKKLLAFKRALVKQGIEFVETAEGTIELLDSFESHIETEEFELAFFEELKVVYLKDLFEELEVDGWIESSGIDEHGSLTYEATTLGKEIVEEEFYGR